MKQLLTRFFRLLFSDPCPCGGEYVYWDSEKKYCDDCGKKY